MASRLETLQDDLFERVLRMDLRDHLLELNRQLRAAVIVIRRKRKSLSQRADIHAKVARSANRIPQDFYVVSHSR